MSEKKINRSFHPYMMEKRIYDLEQKGGGEIKPSDLYPVVNEYDPERGYVLGDFIIRDVTFEDVDDDTNEPIQYTERCILTPKQTITDDEFDLSHWQVVESLASQIYPIIPAQKFTIGTVNDTNNIGLDNLIDGRVVGRYRSPITRKVLPIHERIINIELGMINSTANIIDFNITGLYQGYEQDVYIYLVSADQQHIYTLKAGTMTEAANVRATMGYTENAAGPYVRTLNLHLINNPNKGAGQYTGNIIIVDKRIPMY